MQAKLEALRTMIEVQTKARFAADWERDQARGHNYPLEIHSSDWECRLKPGRKYVNVDVGTSGRYMVELSTGAIYGIKGYSVIHRGHYYGTLDTIEDYDWSDYRAVKLQRAAA